MGNVADCCSKNSLIFDLQNKNLEVGSAPEPYDSAVKGATSSIRSSQTKSANLSLADKKDFNHKSGNRLISNPGSNSDAHKRYMSLLEERRKQMTGGGSDSQKNWEPDDTEMIESTLYLDETTAYQGPLTDDETGKSPLYNSS